MNNLISEDNPITFSIRSYRKGLRAIAYAFTLLLINALVVQDLHAVQDGLKKEAKKRHVVLTGSPEQKMSQALQRLQEAAAEKDVAIMNRLSDESGFMDSVLSFLGMSNIQMEDIDQLKTLRESLREQHTQTQNNLKEEEKRLKQLKLPDEILQRHYDAASVYENTYNEMATKLDALVKAKNLREQGAAIEALNSLMERQKLKKTHQAVDPNDLPWGTPDAKKTRKPGETAEELSQSTGIPNHPQVTMLAANVITPEMLGKPGGPVAEDLVSTIDAQLSDDIRAKALQLGDDPVQIYNWVRNNIEFIPSYGSIQGADYTLKSGKGNAFDSASVLIAMLRAANVPARYAYGTVQIPVDKVMNWVGGVHNAQAAQQLLGQGGIPNVAMVSGGKVTHIKMEHVWVEAWVDYFPSRAAKHKVGDSWIPLDASFKQYEFVEGQRLAENLVYDPNGLIDQITQSALVNDTEGYVQNVNQAAIEAALADYQAEVEAYVADQNPEATVASVLGTRKVILKEFRELSAGLPYQLVARTHNYSQLPDTLRHKFRYTLGSELYGSESQRLITFEKSLPELAGKNLAVSFAPASQADRELIESYLGNLPEPDSETGEIDISQLPNKLPGYLIHLTAQLSEDGSVVKQAAAGTMGGEMYETLALWSPMRGWRSAVNHPVAGETRAIGLDLQGKSLAELEKLRSKVDATSDQIALAEIEDQKDITRTQAVNHLLQSAITSYFVTTEWQAKIESSYADAVGYRLPSFGVYSLRLGTSYWFGIPRDVTFEGTNIDVDHLEYQITSATNDSEKTKELVTKMGVRSSVMEHVISEQLFEGEGDVSGMSAIKALALANNQGQKIWTIDSSNASAASSLALDADIKSEIANAAYNGMVITVHESPVAYQGGLSVGYIISDPVTGAGAYKISGGTNGGDLVNDTVARRLGWAAYGGVNGVAATSLASQQIGVTMGLLGQVLACYEDEVKTLMVIALVIIAALALALLISGGGVVAIPVVMRFLIAAIVGMSASNAMAASRERYICDLKCQVYQTTDPLKGIIGLAYGSACGNDVPSTWAEAKRKAGEDVNNRFGPGHGYRHCTPPNHACKRR